MLHSNINCEASSLEVVSTIKMDAKRVASFDDDSDKQRKKHKYPTERSDRNCAYCRDICKNIERAKTCPGRIGGKSCPHKIAATVTATSSLAITVDHTTIGTDTNTGI